MCYRNKIVVTGFRRSGTTFVGRMLSVDRSVAYLHEPFNYEEGIKEFGINYWYPYINEENVTSQQLKILGKLLNLKGIKSKVSLGDAKTGNIKYDGSRLQLFKNIFANFSNESFLRRTARVFLKNRFYQTYIQSKFNPFKNIYY